MTTLAKRTEDVETVAHLLRRAGFGATRDQIDHYVAKGYEATIEELLNPVLARPEDGLTLLVRKLLVGREDQNRTIAGPHYLPYLASYRTAEIWLINGDLVRNAKLIKYFL